MNNELKISTKDVKVKLTLVNRQSITGTLNIIGYDRLSDFIEIDKGKHLKLYNATTEGNTLNFILVTKVHVLYYELDITKNTYYM